MNREEWDKVSNEILATGALWAVLDQAEAVASCAPVMVDSQATNELHVWFDFLKSRYKVTVTMDPLS